MSRLILKIISIFNKHIFFSINHKQTYCKLIVIDKYNLIINSPNCILTRYKCARKLNRKLKLSIFKFPKIAIINYIYILTIY